MLVLVLVAAVKKKFASDSTTIRIFPSFTKLSSYIKLGLGI